MKPGKAILIGVLLTAFTGLSLMAGCGQKEVKEPGTASKKGAPIKIGFTGALTGPYNEYGEGLRRAMLVALKECNDSGGINGREVQLITRDDQLDPNKALLNMKELIEVEKVEAIIGPAGSGPSMATIPLVEANNLPFTSFAQTIEVVYPKGLEQPPRKNAFAFSMLNDIESYGMADLAAKKWTKIGVLVESTTYGTSMKDWLVKRLATKGVTPVGIEVYDQKDSDMTAQLARLQKAGAEVVINIGLAADAATIRKNMNRLGFKCAFIGTGALSAKPYQDLAGELAEGTILTVAGPFITSPPSRPRAQKFAQKYQEMWGKDRWYGESEWPRTFFVYNAYGYDAITVLMEAMKRAGSTDREAVINQLNNLKGFEGVCADYTFSPNKHHAFSTDFLSFASYVRSEDGKGFKLVPVK